MLVIKLVVAGRGPMEKFESAIRQIERLLKVLNIGLPGIADLRGARRRQASWPQSDSQWPPGIATERCWCRGPWGWCRLHAQPHLPAPPRLAGRRCRQPPPARAIDASLRTATDCRSVRLSIDRCRVSILCLCSSCKCQHRGGRSHEHCRSEPSPDRLHAVPPVRTCGWIVAKAMRFIPSIFRVYVECVKKP